MDFRAAIEIVLASETGKSDVEVRVGKPLPLQDGTGFYCPIQVRGLGDGEVQRIAGADRREALQLAIDTVHARVKALYPEIVEKLRSDSSSLTQ